MNIVAIRPAPIGDSLLIFPILSALRGRYPQAQITFLGHPAVLPLAQTWGLADEVVHPGHIQWYELISPAGIENPALRELLQRADLVICWLDDSDGWIRKNLRMIGVNRFIIAPEREPIHATKNIVEYLAEPLELGPIGTQYVLPPIARSNGFCSFSPPIAIHPGCSEEERRWPAASFAAVINQLLRLQHPVLLLAGPSEADVLKDVQQQLSTPRTPMLSVLQNAPMLELAQRINQCKGFLGNDSGISHLAAQLGVPTLILFGPSDPQTKRPSGPKVEFLREQPLKRLPIDKVLKRILYMLQAEHK